MTTSIEEKASRLENGLSWGRFENSVGPIAFMLSNALATRSVAALAPFGLPAGSLSVLTLIEANPGCSQTDIALTTGMSKSGVVGLIDELERRGLAARNPSPTDRRRNNLSLTGTGEAKLREMVDVQIAEEQAIRDALSAEELTQLNMLLRRAHSAIAKDKAGKARS